MDDITYAAFKIANEIGTTNESDLTYRVKEKFVPNDSKEIENIVRGLFQSRHYFESYSIGNIVPPNPRDEMRLTTHAKGLFLAEKSKRDKIITLEKLNTNQIESVITTNKLTWVNIGVTILFGIIVTSIQIRSCYRDTQKDNLEVHRINQDSLRQLQQLKHDSLFENTVLRIMEGMKDSSKK